MKISFIIFLSVITFYPSSDRAEQLCDSQPDLSKSKVTAAENLQKNFKGPFSAPEMPVTRDNG